MNKIFINISEFLKTIKRFAFLYTAFFGVFFFECAVSEFHSMRVVNLIENIAFSCILFAVFELLRHRVGLVWFQIVFYLLMIFAVVEGVYYLIFDAELSSSAIFIALDTNTSEASEFLNFNLNYSHILYTVGVLFSFVLSWRLLAPRGSENQNTHMYIPITIIVFGVFLLSKPKVYQYNFPYVLTNSIFEYANEQKLLDDLNANESPFSGVVNMSDSENTHIVIIGESTSRLHFGLYGYKRNTTPKLEEIKDKIHLFQDVVSGHTYTIGSLVKALTIKKGDEYVGNIIQLFRQAGYTTYWLSNQPPIGIYETLVTKIALSADKTLFMNSENYYALTPYDEILLPELDKILQNPSSQKIIFIHLMGNHAKYSFRYPTSFANYPTETKDDKQNTINHYDNAILYNDLIVRSIIDKANKSEIPTTVLYFSDHGEEVYDEIDFVGHTANGVFTKNMIEIPFLLWTKSKQIFPESYLNRKFILNDLSHSLADLYKIYADEIDTTRSLIHESYIERPRIVWDSIAVD